MMPIRGRLVVLCLVISLLPALPLSLLVKTLLEKSFDVGLSGTVDAALHSGVDISRQHLDYLHREFEVAMRRLVSRIVMEEETEEELMQRVTSRDNGERLVDGSFVLQHAGSSGSNLPHPFQAFVSDQPLQQLLGEVGPVKARRESTAPDGIAFFDAENRSHQFALWGRFLFVRQNDPAFIEQAKRLLDGRQIFAQLRLTQSTLSRSFFLPFVIVYGIILALSLGLALFMSERLSRPIRQLAAGADVVARGDWTYRLKIRTGGEVGQLVEAFNGMVSRLDRQKRRLVDMERMAAWRDVARHLAHEIKNPLLPIRLTMQELRDQYRGEDPRYEEILDESTRVVGDELHHLTKLVKEFSSFARMPDIEPRCGSLEPLVRDVAKLYPQLSVVVHSAPGLPEFPFDADQMRGVLVNLFDNAASVLPDPAEGEIRIIMGRQDEELLVTFSDNGPGIAHEHLPRIFDPYFTTREEGTGLGLAMVKNVVLLHGGAIDVKSTLGQGTTFTIALPLSGPGAIKNLSRRNQHDGSCSDHR